MVLPWKIALVNPTDTYAKKKKKIAKKRRGELRVEQCTEKNFGNWLQEIFGLQKLNRNLICIFLYSKYSCEISH